MDINKIVMESIIDTIQGDEEINTSTIELTNESEINNDEGELDSQEYSPNINHVAGAIGAGLGGVLLAKKLRNNQ